MYKTRHVSTFCPDTPSGYCDEIDIFNIHQFRNMQFVKWLQSLRPCNTFYYPLWYWMTLILGVSGLIINVYELWRMYMGMEPSSTFRDHRYRFVPPEFRRNVRVLSTVVMVNIYVMFLFGVLKMNPDHITPWIYAHATALTIEMSLWLIDQWSGREPFSIKILIEFVCVYMSWLMVSCVQRTCLLALQKSQTRGFSLYQPT